MPLKENESTSTKKYELVESDTIRTPNGTTLGDESLMIVQHLFAMGKLHGFDVPVHDPEE